MNVDDIRYIHPDHIERINRAVNFINNHLDDPLSLERVAEVASYSPFHFHRLFKEVIHETLNAYIIRKRIEKAASILMRRKDVSITDLYLKYGFNSNSSFTRAFKKFYGLSPTAFRNKVPDQFSKISKTESKNGQITVEFEKDICSISNHKIWNEMNANIEIKEMPVLHIACISHIGHLYLDITYEKLLKWARAQGLLDKPEVKMLTIYHDSFKVTAPDKVRMSACIAVDEPISSEGEIGAAKIEKGKFIVGHFEVAGEDLGKTWSSLFMWLNRNGYKTTERNCFEIYHNDYRTHPERKFILDMYIPID